MARARRAPAPVDPEIGDAREGMTGWRTRVAGPSRVPGPRTSRSASLALNGRRRPRPIALGAAVWRLHPFAEGLVESRKSSASWPSVDDGRTLESHVRHMIVPLAFLALLALAACGGGGQAPVVLGAPPPPGPAPEPGPAPDVWPEPVLKRAHDARDDRRADHAARVERCSDGPVRGARPRRRLDDRGRGLPHGAIPVDRRRPRDVASRAGPGPAAGAAGWCADRARPRLRGVQLRAPSRRSRTLHDRPRGLGRSRGDLGGPLPRRGRARHADEVVCLRRRR